MSYKRSRTTYEADLHAPFATFGTPLPDDPDARDDGSFVPVWKQEVRDDRGRKRLHGAFTGGWSAGYFNTVGSKEGWTPSTFVSSRNNRHKLENAQTQQRAEDYMDEEDLADAAEAQKVQTAQAFAGLGSSNQDANAGGLMGLLRAEGETMGLKLLRRMGWKDGQGIGPKIRRGARLELGDKNAEATETHLFAPDNAMMIQFVRKNDRKGLGHDGEAKLISLNPITAAADEDDDDGDDDAHDAGARSTSLISSQKSKTKPGRGGIGVGILNDNGSDEEDPYEMGPKIRYNRIVGGDKKKKKTKKASAAVNPALKNAPVFVSRTARAGNGLGRCYDGRLPLDGFVLAKITEDLSDLLLEYKPPPVPEGWVSSKIASGQAADSDYKSTADAAKASTHDAKSRAALLGEKSLPGKSVFDYITSSARDRLATASGNRSLPQGLGEVPEGHSMSEEERQQAVWDAAPTLDRETAVAAISRGSTGPYADNEEKKARYRTYLEHFATGNQPLPSKPKGMAYDDFARELSEFHNCARIFKPMTGFMASRFTTAKTSSTVSANDSETDLMSKPEPKVADPAEEAAKVGMYGNMTRAVADFYPTRLLCKRFNVRPPAHSQPEAEAENGSARGRDGGSGPMEDSKMNTTFLAGDVKSIEAAPSNTTPPAPAPEPAINPDKNEAVEGTTAHDEVLKAIFGDSDSE